MISHLPTQAPLVGSRRCAKPNTSTLSYFRSLFNDHRRPINIMQNESTLCEYFQYFKELLRATSELTFVKIRNNFHNSKSFQRFFCCGGWVRTTDLWVMSPTSYHCSTPRYILKNFYKYTKTFSSFQTFGNKYIKIYFNENFYILSGRMELPHLLHIGNVAGFS